ncbi:hypothetical protein [Sulfitobacter sp. S190]|uniref:hypothetical protein n=1 Tax=Sulfitobacter sp. S190 TaxID=2867022 RepID=UPI0021A753B0|nr:hypothetical protein [Sulfitobacter sp. S190]UWR23372.1 hypothetical protein K3756_05125 [Sulfitobacter sp. S190]
MVETRENFSARLDGLGAKHRQMVSRGYTTRVDKNGIIIAKPKRARLHIPARGVMLAVLGFFFFKAFMLSAAGPDAYNERLSSLDTGNPVAAVGLAVMSVDPVTQMIADKMGPLFR